MIIEEEGKEVVKKYKGKEGYSVEGLEQRVTYVFKIMFLNYRVKKIVKTKSSFKKTYEKQRNNATNEWAVLGCTGKIQCR